jgi:hypothetical protein
MAAATKLLALLLLAAVAFAQQMPSLPQKFTANFSGSMTGGGTSTGQLWNGTLRL